MSMPLGRDDYPSVAEFVKAFQAQRGTKALAKGVAAGLIVGYALRNKS